MSGASLIGAAPDSPMYDSDGKMVHDWVSWFTTAYNILNATTLSGTTANRPVKFLYTSRTYFDTTLGKPIWYKTAGWVDATGAAV